MGLSITNFNPFCQYILTFFVWQFDIPTLHFMTLISSVKITCAHTEVSYYLLTCKHDTSAWAHVNLIDDRIAIKCKVGISNCHKKKGEDILAK